MSYRDYSVFAYLLHGREDTVGSAVFSAVFLIRVRKNRLADDYEDPSSTRVEFDSGIRPKS